MATSAKCRKIVRLNVGGVRFVICHAHDCNSPQFYCTLRKSLLPPPQLCYQLETPSSLRCCLADTRVRGMILVPSLLTVRSRDITIVLPSHFPFTGSPKYFGPILHYLRTNNLEIPSGVSCTSLRDEAEFYGIQKIVDHINDHLEKEKAKRDPPQKGN